MKIKILIAVLAVVAAVFGFVYLKNIKMDSSDKSELIKVFRPAGGAVVSSPLVIEGEARGFWFFEASFPIKLIDENNNLIVQHYVQAEGDWMTDNFVSFRSEVFFNTDVEKGFLVLEKNNPSGLAENADELIIPISFEKEKMVIKVFFSNNRFDPDFSCNKVFPVERAVLKTPLAARAALEELFKGPIESEIERGFLTNLPPGVKINKITIENGVAKADFNNLLEFQVGGSCRVAAIRSQITETLKQFPTVKNVIISINGRTEGILQP